MITLFLIATLIHLSGTENYTFILIGTNNTNIIYALCIVFVSMYKHVFRFLPLTSTLIHLSGTDNDTVIPIGTNNINIIYLSYQS